MARPIGESNHAQCRVDMFAPLGFVEVCKQQRKFDVLECGQHWYQVVELKNQPYMSCPPGRKLALLHSRDFLASYGDARASMGRCEVRADLQRPLAGKTALVVDDVFDTGLSLSEARRLVRDAGAAEVLTCVFATKPWPTARAIEPDFVAWDAPARYLVGYGLDDAGAWRGLPYVGALD